MKRKSKFILRILASTVSVVLLASTFPFPSSGLTTADAAQTTTISNPIIWADVPDEDIIRVGDTYYMVSTTMYFSPGAPIMKSKDLVSWEICNYVYDTYADGDKQTLKNGENDYSHGQWAASLRYHDGNFYVFFGSYGTGKSYIYKTSDIENGDAQRIEQIAWMLFLKVYDTKEDDWEFDDDAFESIIPEECRWRNWAVDNGKGTAITGDELLDFINNTLFPALKGIQVSKTTPINKAIVKTTFEDTNNYMKDGVLLRQVVNVIDELKLDDYEESHAFGDIYESILKELQSAGSAGEFYTPRAVTDFMTQMIQPKIGEIMADFACGTGGFITSWLKALEPQMKTVEDRVAFDTSVYGIEKKQFPYMLCVTNLLLHNIDTPRIYHDNSLLKDVLDYTEEDQFDVILMNPPYGGSEKTDVKNHFPSDLASSETADLFMSVIMYRLKQNGRAAVILPDGFLFGTDNAKVAIKKKLLSEFNLHTIIRMPHSVFAPYTSITTNILFFDRTQPTKETWFYRLDMPDGYKNFSKTKPMKLEHFTPAVEWWHNREEIVIDGFDKAKKYTAEELIERNYNIDLCGFPHEEEEILPPKELIQQYQEKRASLNADIDRILAQITDILGINMEELS